MGLIVTAIESSEIHENVLETLGCPADFINRNISPDEFHDEASNILFSASGDYEASWSCAPREAEGVRPGSLGRRNDDIGNGSGEELFPASLEDEFSFGQDPND